MPSPSSNGGASSGAADITGIRTLALVGPAAAGKTSLAEALLHQSGAIGAPGTLERGSTVSDHDPLERRMQHSLSASVMHLHHAGTRVHFIDTPGAPDFIGQSLPALEAVETAAIVINALNGIEPMALRMMEYAAQRQLDRMIIVNKIDAQGVDLPALLAQIRQAFGSECLPLNLPDEGGTKVVDCFYNRAGDSDFGSVEDAHRALVEQVVEVDADFVDRYLNDGDIDAVRAACAAGAGAARRPPDPGVFRLGAQRRRRRRTAGRDRQAAAEPERGQPARLPERRGHGRAADARRARPGQARAGRTCSRSPPTRSSASSASSACTRARSRRTASCSSATAASRSRSAICSCCRARTTSKCRSALPGDICAVAKVDELHFDAVLHDAAEDEHIHLKPLAFPVPVHGLAISPKRHGDEQRMWEILNKLVAEDPACSVEHVATTNETVVYGLGELHLRMLLERLREVYKFDVDTAPPRIAYRETVTAPAEGHHRHKKQTGGAGQFGEVFLRIEPLPRGAGFEFVDQVKGGTIPGQFIPAVEKGVREVLASGAIAGYPVVDVRVIVYDGKHHSVDSKEIAFVTAGRKAFMDAIRKARPIVLEPIVQHRHPCARGARWATSPATCRPSAARSAARATAPARRWS